jgi:heme exporter protein A
MQPNQLEASHLSCQRQYKLIFADVSFALQKGEALLVEGPNGAGKSSLLRILTGIASPSAGDVYWQGKPIESSDDYKTNLHYIGHRDGIKLGLTVIENLRLSQQLAEAKPADINNILSLLNLTEQANTQTFYLSAGQKRRVALAALFLYPKILWILDEPLTALDLPMQHFFLERLESHLQNDGIAVISSHHPFTLRSKTKHLRLEGC